MNDKGKVIQIGTVRSKDEVPPVKKVAYSVDDLTSHGKARREKEEAERKKRNNAVLASYALKRGKK